MRSYMYLYAYQYKLYPPNLLGNMRFYSIIY